MKQIRKIIPLAFATVVLFGMSGCNKPVASTPSKEEAEETTVKVSPEVTASPTDTTVDTTGTFTTLEDFREKITSENPYVEVAMAYIGTDRVEDISRAPTDNRTIAHYDALFSSIDDAHRIDVSNGADTADVFCIVPMAPSIGITVYKEETDTKQEVVYHADTAEPILLRCNENGFDNARVELIYPYETLTYYPKTTPYCGKKRMVQSNDDTLFDFTLYNETIFDSTIDDPTGDWNSIIYDAQTSTQRLKMFLSLHPMDGSAEMILRDSQSGDFMANYTGYWIKKEEEKSFDLHLTVEENTTGLSEYDVPIEITASYFLMDNYCLELRVEQVTSSPLPLFALEEALSLYPNTYYQTHDEDPNQICPVILNYHEAMYQSIPSKCEIENITTAGVLIHLYDDMGSHTATAGWYLINPNTMQGSDELTGALIDFLDYQEKLG